MTITDVIKASRDITLDHFPQPAFLAKKKSDVSDSLSLSVTDKAVSFLKDVDVSFLESISLDDQKVLTFNPEKYEYSFFLDPGRPGEIKFKKGSDVSTVTTTRTVIEPDYHIEEVITITSFSGALSTTYIINLFFRNPRQLRTLTLNNLPYNEVSFYPVKSFLSFDFFLFGVKSKLTDSAYSFSESDIEDSLSTFIGNDFSEKVYVPDNFPALDDLRLSLASPTVNYTFSIVDDNTFKVTFTDDDFEVFYDLVNDQSPLLSSISVNGEVIDSFFPEKKEYTIDIPIDYQGDIEIDTVPFLPFDNRHQYVVSEDFSQSTHKILVSTELNGTTIHTYTLNIKYVNVSYPSDIKEHEVVSYPFSIYEDVISLGRAMKVDQSQPFVFDFWPTLITSDDSSILQPSLTKNFSPEEPTVIYRKYFFSDEHYEDVIRRYFDVYFKYRTPKDDLVGAVKALDASSFQHIVLWTSFHMLEDRRKYELAAQSLVGGADNFDLQDGYDSLYSSQAGPGTDVQVQIGSVFTLRETEGESSSSGKKSGGAVAQVGADNIFGDDNSFWYRLQGSVRKRFEDIYRDYNLRPNEVIEGTLEFQPVLDHNFMAFFDSYPYTISPYSRGIMGGGRSVTDSSASYTTGGLV